MTEYIACPYCQQLLFDDLTVCEECKKKKDFKAWEKYWSQLKLNKP